MNQTNGELNQIVGSEDYPSYFKFRSFRNSDSTWGFTLFLNSKPYLHYKKIPFPGAVSGFQSKNDAENVAGLFIRMIRTGVLTPKLDIKAVDSLGIIIKFNR
jgi:hypothetical protein